MAQAVGEPLSCLSMVWTWCEHGEAGKTQAASWCLPVSQSFSQASVSLLKMEVGLQGFLLHPSCRLFSSGSISCWDFGAQTVLSTLGNFRRISWPFFFIFIFWNLAENTSPLCLLWLSVNPGNHWPIWHFDFTWQMKTSWQLSHRSVLEVNPRTGT